MTDRDRLLADYLAGALEPEGQRALLEALRADPGFAREAADHLLTERLLRLRLGQADAGTFAREVLEVIGAKPSGERFAREVVERVKRRSRTRRAVRSASWFVPALVAAGLLLGIVILATLAPSRPAPLETREARTPPPSLPREEKQAEPERSRPPEMPRVEAVPVAKPPEEPVRPPPEPKPQPEKPPPASVPSPPPPAPPAPPAPETKPALATLDHAQGEAFVLGPEGEKPAPPGQALSAGDGLRATIAAVLACPDGTRLELGKETSVRDFRDGPRGKALLVARGTVTAEVAKQPAGRAWTFETPHGEARVLGTTLRLAVDASSTRLEVREGRVRFTRKEDNASVELAADQFVLATKGLALAAKPLRASGGLLALYLFREGAGAAVRDVSGAGEPLDLQIEVPAGAAWKPRGLAIQSRSLIASPGPPAKILQVCRKSREITLEAWVTPTKAQADYEGCIVGLGSDEPQRNFLLAQGSRNHGFNLWAGWIRTGAGGGMPLVAPPRSAEARLTHLAYARAATGVERLYVNGLERAARVAPGDFAGWDDTLRLCLADETATGERMWTGEYHLVAVYGRALTPQEVVRNLRAGLD